MKYIIKFFIPVVIILILIIFSVWLHFYAPCNLAQSLSTVQNLPARCLNNATNQNKDINVSNTNISTSTNSFEKQVQCSNLQTDIIKEVSAFNMAHFNNPEKRDTNNAGGPPMYRMFRDEEFFKSVFYSSKLDTCIAVIEPVTEIQGLDGNWARDYDSYEFENAFTKEVIDFVQIIHRGELFGSFGDYDKKVQEYR